MQVLACAAARFHARLTLSHTGTQIGPGARDIDLLRDLVAPGISAARPPRCARRGEVPTARFHGWIEDDAKKSPST